MCLGQVCRWLDQRACILWEDMGWESGGKLSPGWGPLTHITESSYKQFFPSQRRWMPVSAVRDRKEAEPIIG